MLRGESAKVMTEMMGEFCDDHTLIEKMYLMELRVFIKSYE